MDPKDTPTQNLPTDLDIGGSGIVFREVRKVWMKAARADIRLELQKNLKARNLGLPDVENFALNQAKQRHSNKFKDKRISVQIQSDMNVKLRDAYQAVRETTFEKSKLRRKLDSILKNDVSLKEKIYGQLDVEVENTKTFLRRKNETKVQNLEKK